MSMSEFTRPTTTTATGPIQEERVFATEPAVGSGATTGYETGVTQGVGSGVNSGFVEPGVNTGYAGSNTGVNSGLVGSGVQTESTGFAGSNTGVNPGFSGSNVGVNPGLAGSGAQTSVGTSGSTPVYSSPNAPVYAPSDAGVYPTTPYSAEQTTVSYQTGATPLTGSQVQYAANSGGSTTYEPAIIPANINSQGINNSSAFNTSQGINTSSATTTSIGNSSAINTSQGIYNSGAINTSGYEHVRAAPVHTHFVEQEVVEVVPVVVIPPISTLTVVDAQAVNYGQNPQSVESRWRNRLNAITLAHNAHEQQNQYYQKLLARHEFNVEQTGNMQTFFQRRAEASKAYAKALNALPKMYNNAYGQPIPHHGSLESILERINEVTVTEASVHQKFGDQIDTANAEKFGRLHNQIKSSHGALTEGYKTHNRRLGQLRTNADRSLNQWSSNASIPAGEHYKPTYDPWLRETRFLHHFSLYRNGLDEYNSWLHTSFQKTQELDNQRVNTLKASMIEVLRLQQSLTVNQFNTSIEAGLAAIDSPTISPDFHKYAHTSGLTRIASDDSTVLANNFHSNLPRSYRTDAVDVADDFDYYAYKKMGTPAPLHHANYVPTSDYTGEVEHMGQLDMSSRKGSTKPYLWVLSKYGYLHQFSAAKLDKPKMSVAAKYCNVSPADAHGDFKIDYKQPGLHTRHNFYVRATNQAEGAIWAQKINAAGQRAVYNY